MQGFNRLCEDDLREISNFLLLWSLFEARIMDTHCNVSKICKKVEQWEKDKPLDIIQFDQELKYFQDRYFRDDEITYHFCNLKFGKRDQKGLVRAVIKGEKNEPRDKIVAMLIIVYRYRNNLFHGEKWRYQLIDQIQNFKTANSTLKKLLEQYGNLENG